MTDPTTTPQSLPTAPREALARAIDPDAFEDHPIERTVAVAALQWAVRRKYATDAADAALAWFAASPPVVVHGPLYRGESVTVHPDGTQVISRHA